VSGSANLKPVGKATIRACDVQRLKSFRELRSRLWPLLARRIAKLKPRPG